LIAWYVGIWITKAERFAIFTPDPFCWYEGVDVMIRQIFIGGTGRSGTTILSKILGKHSEIFRYPFETRFIIDPDGLIDLIPALSDQWSPWKGDSAVRRFEKLMWEIYPPRIRGNLRRFLSQAIGRVGISPPRYALWKSYKDIIPREEYLKALNDFINKLYYKKFSGYWVGTPAYWIRPKIIATKRFEKSEILALASTFVNKISLYPMKKENKKIWLDHTPFNILHAHFLYELFPEMKLIHIYRDPRDVISSYKTKKWGGNSAMDNILLIKYIFNKWDDEKTKIPEDKYYEVKLEDLVRRPEKELKNIVDFLGIKYEKNLLSVDLSKSHSGRWKKDLSKEEVEVIEKHLKDILNKYNY